MQIVSVSAWIKSECYDFLSVSLMFGIIFAENIFRDFMKFFLTIQKKCGFKKRYMMSDLVMRKFDSEFAGGGDLLPYK